MTRRVAAPDTLRAFLAVEIGSAARARIAELTESLQRPVPPGTGLRGIRWVRPEGIHLTLRFLGDTAPEALPPLQLELARAAAACPPGEARIAGLGTFPERGRVRVLWLSLELPEPVLELQRACERAAVAAGFAEEPRPFHCHLTLGRWREPVPRPTLPDPDLGTTRLETLVLFRSELRPGGAVYSPLATFTLAGA